MDKVTQSSAAGAEETAAQAEELDAQAAELTGVIGQLRVLVEGAATRPAAATRSAAGVAAPDRRLAMETFG